MQNILVISADSFSSAQQFSRQYQQPRRHFGEFHVGGDAFAAFGDGGGAPEHLLDFTIRHVGFKGNVLTQLLVTMLNVSLELSLEPITVYWLGLGSIWVPAMRQGASI